ncbi:hypothetical protein DPEC_G00154140 [Dallia pectoralis]|uniref:Uncharacterized protein n=1 Tax=Dallia pectoralis TaxID=75939 RepID=A0ACC2GJQ9_DALPE|nr:hypothetical protein DPEC_G00154140 [Dallia pectoralis]
MAEKQTPTSKNGSRSSASSQYSNSSSKGSVAVAIARAKAEAAKARLSFAAKEMRMKMEKAQLEASIEFLQQEKETAAALAEAEALEAATDPNTEKGSSRLDLNLNPIEPAQRTQEYLIQQAKSHDTLQSIPYVESFSVNETGQRHTGLKPTPPMLTSHYKTELISTPEDNTAAMDHRSPKSDIRPTQRSEHLTFSTHNTHRGQSVHWSAGAAYGDGDRPPDPYLGPTSQKAQGLCLDIQPTPCLSHGWVLGEDDRHSKENLGLYVPRAKEFYAYSRSTYHSHGRSGRHHQCKTLGPSLYRP